MSELKACPFCGREAREARVMGRMGIICLRCHACMRSDEIASDDATDVVENWNTRPEEDRLRALLKRAIKELHYTELLPENEAEQFDEYQMHTAKRKDLLTDLKEFE